MTFLLSKRMNLELSLFTRYAGLVVFSWDWHDDANPRTLHFLVKPRNWQLGFCETWYDGPWKSYGLGPLALFCWRWWEVLPPESE